MTDEHDRKRRQTPRNQHSTGRRSAKSGQQAQSENLVAAIDRMLLTRVKITIGGKRTIVTALEAIVMQLLSKGMTGDTRARRTLRRYMRYAAMRAERRMEIAFVDSSYTEILASWKANAGDE